MENIQALINSARGRNAIDDDAARFIDSRHREQFRLALETLGLEHSFETATAEAIRSDNQEDSIPGGEQRDAWNQLRRSLESALEYGGDHVARFANLAKDIRELQSPYGVGASDILHSERLERVQINLESMSGYFGDQRPVRAWKVFRTLWSQGDLSPEDVFTLLDAFDAYFLLLGLENEGFRTWESIIARIAKLKPYRPSASQKIANITADIHAELDLGP